jgi:hypothetical protein
VSRMTLEATESPERNAQALQLLEDYRIGLRDAVQDAGRDGDQDGWACLESLARFLRGWFLHPRFFDLWTAMTAAPVEGQHEERALLDSLARATGTADPADLGDRVRVIVYGSATAAALDNGQAAAETLDALLARTWRDHSNGPVLGAGTGIPRSAGWLLAELRHSGTGVTARVEGSGARSSRPRCTRME